MRQKHVCRSHASAVVYLHPSSPKSALLPPWATGTFRLPNSVRGATAHRVLCLPNSAGCCETTGLVSHTPSACRVLMNIVTQRDSKCVLMESEEQPRELFSEERLE